MRIGIGYDSHRLVKGRKLILGGVDIPFDKGLIGHSDADVLCHAIIDALLGAQGRGDIGIHFPDSEPRWKDASSIDLLAKTVARLHRDGFSISWVDSVLILEQPKIVPYVETMKEIISGTGIPAERINIKAKTNEGMGCIGRGEGIAAYAVCTLRSA